MRSSLDQFAALHAAVAYLGEALPEPLGVLRRLQQVHGLLEGAVLVGRDEESRALLGDDLDGHLVVVDLFDEREQALARLARSHGHDTSIDNLYGKPYHLSTTGAPFPRTGQSGG